MNEKNIAKSVKWKLDDWCKTIDDPFVVKTIKKSAIVTGGSLVSLLNGETPNDYDIYFKDYSSCKVVAEYYAEKWNEVKDNEVIIQTKEDEEGPRVVCDIVFDKETDESSIDDETEPLEIELEVTETTESNVKGAEVKPKYRPRYFTPNAISLSDGIQLVIRFTGDVDKIHENYDFIHCTCSYDYETNKVNLPQKALVAIINKELIYMGSKYPLCSIIRTRKFIKRGWKINAGQYLKMALQLNDLQLDNIEILREQLVGVDSAYFGIILDAMENKADKEGIFKLENAYIFDLINKVF